MIGEHYDLSMGDQTLCITSIHLVELLNESLVERNSEICDWASSFGKSELHLLSDDMKYLSTKVAVFLDSYLQNGHNFIQCICDGKHKRTKVMDLNGESDYFATF